MRRLKGTILLLAAICSPLFAEECMVDFGDAVRQFSAVRHKLASDLASQLRLPLPSQAEAFFRAAETDRWESVSNRFEQVKETGDNGGAIRELHNELWAPIHETLGVWEVWEGWKQDSSLLAMFYAPVLSSMPKGSIYFGGTEYGRFLITAVNALREPPPVFCITQNALADNTYAAYLRAIYGDRIWLPKKEDSAQAFQRYFQEIQSGMRAANSQLTMENGRVQVSGALGVMEINGILCEMIFEHNKDDHDFFVEESYVINWMYPYLEPHGLIMKLNRQRLAGLPEQVVADDRDFWAQYEKRLSGHPGFATNTEARKAFAKLRCAGAGIYTFRGMYGEAEAAFRQALRLCPASPEASYCLADMYLQQEETGKALAVMQRYLKCVPPDQKQKAEEYKRQLEDRMQNHGTELVH